MLVVILIWLVIIYLSLGSTALGYLAKWCHIDLFEARHAYAWSWHWRYLFCLLIWPILCFFMLLQNTTLKDSK